MRYRSTVGLVVAVAVLAAFAASTAAARNGSSAEPPTISLKAANRYAKTGVAEIYSKPSRATLGSGAALEDVFTLKEVLPCERAVLRHPRNPQLNKPYPGHFDCHAIVEIVKRQYSPSGEITQEETETAHRAYVEVTVERAHKPSRGTVGFPLKAGYEVFVLSI